MCVYSAEIWFVLDDLQGFSSSSLFFYLMSKHSFVVYFILYIFSLIKFSLAICCLTDPLFIFWKFCKEKMFSMFLLLPYWESRAFFHRSDGVWSLFSCFGDVVGLMFLIGLKMTWLWTESGICGITMKQSLGSLPEIV